MAMRRLMCKQPRVLPMLHTIMLHYTEHGHPGCCLPADTQEAQSFRLEGKHHGPLGLLLATLHRNGCKMDAQWAIYRQGHQVMHLLDTPHQRLKPITAAMARHGRQLRAEALRPTIAGNGELGPPSMRVLPDAAQDEKRVLKR
eukprot:773183-Alexandrium_andersonii.AAC.1